MAKTPASFDGDLADSAQPPRDGRITPAPAPASEPRKTSKPKRVSALDQVMGNDKPADRDDPSSAWRVQPFTTAEIALPDLPTLPSWINEVEATKTPSTEPRSAAAQIDQDVHVGDLTPPTGAGPLPSTNETVPWVTETVESTLSAEQLTELVAAPPPPPRVSERAQHKKRRSRQGFALACLIASLLGLGSAELVHHLRGYAALESAGPAPELANPLAFSAQAANDLSNPEPQLSKDPVTSLTSLQKRLRKALGYGIPLSPRK